MRDLDKAELISDYLIINSSFISDVGLCNGKMGISIFFYHLSEETNNSIYRDFADQLLDEILACIDETLSCNFETGLIGICIGLTYLSNKNFIQIEDASFFTDIESLLINGLQKEFNSNEKLLEINKYFDYITMPKAALLVSNLLETSNRVSDLLPIDLFEIISFDEETCLASFECSNLGLKRGCAGVGFKLLF